MTDLPSGTVAFLFTDIEGSTRAWEYHPEAMRPALERQDALLRRSVHAHRGHVFKTIGDAYCVAFHTPAEALAAALASQQELLVDPPGEEGPLRVRMALNVGAAELRNGDYLGPALNRVARLLGVGHGGQVLVSQAVYDLVRDVLSEGVELRDLGEHSLKDCSSGCGSTSSYIPLSRPTSHRSSRPADFPPLLSLDVLPNNLPPQLTTFVGREREMAEIKRLLAGTRLLTLTGAAGSGNAIGCWGRSASTRETAWWKPAKLPAGATAIGTGSWSWPRRRLPSSAARIRGYGSNGSSRNTRTFGPPSSGARPNPRARKQGSGWQRLCTASGWRGTI